MSRRAAIVEVEDEFDDDTDLPLPTHPLPNTGASGPLLQELYIDEDGPSQRAGPASPPYVQPQFRPPPPGSNKNSVTDMTPYKSWTCIYPIYLDAKRPYGTGQRRVSRERGLWWPLSKDIADATNSLGLSTLHEVGKAHPRDWENPGRVRVLWKKDWPSDQSKYTDKFVSSTEKHLLETVAARIQLAKPTNKPVPPYLPTASATPAPAPTPVPAPSGKGKQPSAAPAPRTKIKTAGRHAPAPPLPHPPLATRLSPYSPALASGMLVDAVKAGMNAQAQEAAAQPGTPGAGAPPGAPGAAQKGKRRVVRVRG
ncbi:hypothetical protein C8J57DRAFT_1721839 [Mycena rebaudengoi]|nr:hypothetical protein C8J57DRAFT_1721839 [Mycena rebaudengoi]